MKLASKILLLAVGIMLAACSKEPETLSAREAQAIHAGEECHLCGMFIKKFPGPKGELYLKTSDKIKKFCSTRDMFTFLLDPEYKKQVKEAYVHDMSKAHWKTPDDNHFIDARTAWYVIGSSQKGAMGKTLASFVDKLSAERFVTEFGGKVRAFNEITLTEL
ncbi:MAG: nitrous oxide reductase accessory protein NosL [Parashewanella sp.]